MKRIAAEAIGTAFLLAGVVGSGIMAERLSGGNLAIALLANALATGGVLFAIIVAFAPISGAHFNPVVTLSVALQGSMKWREAAAYVFAQIVGAIAGVATANTMFGDPAIFFSHRARHGPGLLLGEFVATFGLIAVIKGASRASSTAATAMSVAAYIVGAYWFTSSTSFANPAVTIARSLTDTFAGIAPADVAGFVAAQVLGALAAVAFFAWLSSERRVNAMKRSVLFVCIHNSARSQMAEAFLKELCAEEFDAESAGIEPGTLNPLAVAVMQEIGIDISRNATKSVADLLETGKRYTYVVTVCDDANAERCPVFPGSGQRLHWSFSDPSAIAGAPQERLDKDRVSRDQIRSQIQSWCIQAC